MTLRLELSPEEALGLRNLLDTAVRAGGMQAAELALPIDARIRAAGALHEEERTLERAAAIRAARAGKRAINR